MRKYKIKQIDAFTNSIFSGNPAGVVPSAEGLSDKEMQLIAKEMNLSETAFILPSKKADFRIRWFTPKKEVLFCGHATIASLHALAEEGKFGMNKAGYFSFKIETKVGILNADVNVDVKKDGKIVDCTSNNKSIKVILQSPAINLVKENCDKKRLAEALRIREEDIDVSYPTMRDKTVDYIYVVLKKLSVLKKVDYDYNKLEAFGDKYKIKGFTLLTKETFEKDSNVHSRFFTPFYGVREDPVTGSSQGPLGVYLVLNKMVELKNNEVEIKSEQGDIMGRRGRLIVKVTENLNSKKENGNYISKLISKAVTVLDGVFVLK